MIKILILSTIAIFSCREADRSKVNETGYDLILEKALEHIEKREFSSAIVSINLLLKGDSSNGMLYLKRGYCYVQIDSFDLAINDFNQSIVLDYEPAKAHMNLGIIHELLRGPDSVSFFHFKKSFALDSTNETTRQFLELYGVDISDETIL